MFVEGFGSSLPCRVFQSTVCYILRCEHVGILLRFTPQVRSRRTIRGFVYLQHLAVSIQVYVSGQYLIKRFIGIRLSCFGQTCTCSRLVFISVSIVHFIQCILLPLANLLRCTKNFGADRKFRKISKRENTT